MKRIFTKIPAFGFIVAVLFAAGCLSDDLERSDNGSGTGSTEPTIPDNSVIDAGVFSALNLDYPGLAAVKTSMSPISTIWRRRLCWNTTVAGLT